MTFEILIMLICGLIAIAKIVEIIIRCIASTKINSAKHQAQIEYENVCDACGNRPKQPNSMLCKECERKAYDNSEHQEHT